MLRNFILGFGIAFLAAGAAIFVMDGFGPSIVLFAWGAILVFGVLYERFRYKSVEKGHPGAGWEKTSERFIDDESGKPVTVYIRPETGERRYVEE